MSSAAGPDAQARTRIERALSEGLAIRPIGETARDTLAWAQARLRDGHKDVLGTAGLAVEKEAAVLAAWHARSGR